MDRTTVYRNQLPYESDVLEAQQFPMEALGLFMRDLIGETTQVGGFVAAPTAPASMAITVGPGRIYKFVALESSDWGDLASVGGLPADTEADHFIVKQGKIRETTTFPVVAPATGGHSVKYLIEVEFVEEDDAPTTAAFYNVASPSVPLSDNVSRHRRTKAVLYSKIGVAGVSPTVPAVTAGRFPLWVVTVANGDTTITGGDIVEHDDAPFVAVGGGGGGGSGLAPWQVVASTYTAVTGDRLIAKTGGGSFTLTLPAAPASGDEVTIKGSWLTNNLTIARNGATINGSATDLIGDKNNQTLFLVYDGTTWVV